MFITGTDTEVGKTTVACALARAWKRQGLRVGVMKPFATGCRRENRELVSRDVELLLKASGSRSQGGLVSPYRFEPPAAPWVAAARTPSPFSSPPRGGEGRVRGLPISLDRIEQAFHLLTARHDIVLVEGIGGLRVPLDERYTVADLARRLGLPVLIVARAGLGTINHTLLTLEAARSAGLEVLGVVMNGLSRSPSLAERTNPGVIRRLGKVRIFGSIPRFSRPAWRRIGRRIRAGEILQSLQGWQAQKKNRIRRLARLDRKRIWHPFTQMSEWQRSEPLVVESADGVYLKDTRGNRYLDGVSSLWVNLHGHAHPALDGALRLQLGKIAHSTLLGAANVPSIELAKALTDLAPLGLNRVFYSDNGSTAVEIALKMAFQYWQQNGSPRRRRFVHFVNAYHGDTIGSVSVGGIDLFHKVYGPLLFKGFKVPSPYCYRCPLKLKYPSCKIACLAPLEKTLAKHHREIAGVVVEPLVQGAAGMITQPPGWLKRVERACRRYGIFLIADEVAVGFGRTGTLFACPQEGVRPDFLCVAKGLSGGTLPLAATLTTERVYRGFLGSYASLRTFFHGHSYTGNPLACAAGLANLRLFKQEKVLKRLKPKIRLFARELKSLESLPHVGQVRQRGLVAGIELVKDKRTKASYPWQARMGIRVCEFLRSRGILLRPLSNVIVLMPPLAITPEQLRHLCHETFLAIQGVTESAQAPAGDL